ncbi:hypothetical protein KHQ88_06205 [Mycoplasmatota bacterium]|nr:hypothetical protein KHQ88_06205 [Mycoplasmatota bacterium]
MTYSDSSLISFNSDTGELIYNFEAITINDYLVEGEIPVNTRDHLVPRRSSNNY